MKIQKGIVKYKDRNDIVCFYGVTDDGRQYYFLDETDEKKFSNGNRIASKALVEAIDPMVKAANIGVVDEAGNEVVPFDNKSIRPINNDIILVEKAQPVTQSVISAIELRNDPAFATQLVSTPATIKSKLNEKMGDTGRYLFNDQFSEATVCDINGNNLVNNEYFSFIGMTHDKLYFSKNTVDSIITEYSILPPEVQSDVTPNYDKTDINVSAVEVSKDVVENALNESAVQNNNVNTFENSDVQRTVGTDDIVIPSIGSDDEENNENDSTGFEPAAGEIPTVEDDALINEDISTNDVEKEKLAEDAIDKTIMTQEKSESNEEIVGEDSEEAESDEEVIEEDTEEAESDEEVVEDDTEEAEFDEEIVEEDAEEAESDEEIVEEDAEEVESDEEVVEEDAEEVESDEEIVEEDAEEAESDEEVVEEDAEEVESDEEVVEEDAEEAESDEEIVEDDTEEAESDEEVVEDDTEEAESDEEVDDNIEEPDDDTGREKIINRNTKKTKEKDLVLNFEDENTNDKDIDSLLEFDNGNDLDTIDDYQLDLDSDFEKDMSIDNDIFNDSIFRADKIVNDYNDSFSNNDFRDSSSNVRRDNIMSDVANSMANLIRQNKEQRNIITKYQEKLERINSTRRSIVDKVKVQEQKIEVLTNKIRNMEKTLNNLESKNQILESKNRDQEKVILAQTREIEELRPQLAGKEDLVKVLADAQVLLGEDNSYSYDY